MNTTIAQQIADEGGVEAYLHAQQYKSLLRFLTCGSVDDGKVPDWSSAARHAPDLRRSALFLHNDSKRHGTQGENSTWRCWWTACRRSASRALPLMSPIATSLPKAQIYYRRHPGARAVHP